MGHVPATRRKVRSGEDFDIIIGFLGFWAVVLLVVTVWMEVTAPAGPRLGPGPAGHGAGPLRNDPAAPPPAAPDGQPAPAEAARGIRTVHLPRGRQGSSTSADGRQAPADRRQGDKGGTETDRAQRGGHSGVSIEDVAAAAGVSTATVSRAVRGLPRVSPATREKILGIAEALGYVASSSASGLATGRTKTIGVLAPFVSRWFFSKAIEGADRELHARQYNLSLFNLGGHGSNRERLFSKTMVYKQIDALLVLCMALTHEEIEHLQKIDIPLVVVGGHVEECPYIGIDDYAAAATAVRHLIGLGPHGHRAPARRRRNRPQLRRPQGPDPGLPGRHGARPA